MPKSRLTTPRVRLHTRDWPSPTRARKISYLQRTASTIKLIFTTAHLRGKAHLLPIQPSRQGFRCSESVTLMARSSFLSSARREVRGDSLTFTARVENCLGPRSFTARH